MNNMDLIRKFLNLKCIAIDDNDWLYRIDGRTCDDIEDLLIISINGDMTDPWTLGNKALADDKAHFREIRNESWYYYKSIPNYSSGLLASIIENINDGHEIDEYLLMLNGWPTSRAWSIRTNEESSEAAVETKPEYRQMGHAKAVLYSWIEKQFAFNKTAYYCCRSNYQSQKLAQSLNAILICNVVSCFI